MPEGARAARPALDEAAEVPVELQAVQVDVAPKAEPVLDARTPEDRQGPRAGGDQVPALAGDVIQATSTKSTKLTGDWDAPPPRQQALPAAVAEELEAARVPGLFAATVRGFAGAIEGELDPATGRARNMLRAPFVEGLEACAAALDHIGGGLGSYLVGNIKKLHKSKADASLPGYREWLLSELPAHESGGYRGYLDESAFMANLWLGWTLEFFVELFALVHGGRETRESVDVAYKQTLSHHHNFFQRSAFQVAVKALPNRENIIARLRADDSLSSAEALEELGDFVRTGRVVAQFVLQMNEEADTRMKSARQTYLKR